MASNSIKQGMIYKRNSFQRYCRIVPKICLLILPLSLCQLEMDKADLHDIARFSDERLAWL